LRSTFLKNFGLWFTPFRDEFLVVMNKFILGLIVGIVLSGACVWYIGNHHLTGNARSPSSDAVGNSAAQKQDLAREKMDSLNLTVENIKDEMLRSGRIARAKAQNVARAVADAAVDAGTTTAIKAKYVADVDLSALSISFNTTDGVVTLSGTASSPANIRKAIQLAYDTDGVNQVISTIQVKE
jgi:hypothetical protein